MQWYTPEMETNFDYHCVERHFLNLPGFQSGAYVRAEVESTFHKTPRLPTRELREDETLYYDHYQPNGQLVLQIADCDRHIDFEFNLNDANERANSFHKIDTLISALQSFREALVVESRNKKKHEKVIDAAFKAAKK